MSMRELWLLINIIQDRTESVPVISSRFKAGMIVNRRLTRQFKDSLNVLKNDNGTGNYISNLE